METAKATEEIARHILAVQKLTGGAVEAVQGIEQGMHEIDTRASSAAASILEQNAATSEISRNAANAARGTNLVVAVLGKVAEAATGRAAPPRPCSTPRIGRFIGRQSARRDRRLSRSGRGVR